MTGHSNKNSWKIILNIIIILIGVFLIVQGSRLCTMDSTSNFINLDLGFKLGSLKLTTTNLGIALSALGTFIIVWIGISFNKQVKRRNKLIEILTNPSNFELILNAGAIITLTILYCIFNKELIFIPTIFFGYRLFHKNDA